MSNFVMSQPVYMQLRMTLIMCLCWCALLSGVASQLTDPNEVRALRDIRSSLRDQFRQLTSWDRGDPCNSSWSGINCYGGPLDDGYLHVEELMLLNRNLTGTLSPALGQLSRLRILDFMWNNITGSIPREIGSITSLELLLLNGNLLTGSLPDELGNLTNLDRIQIDQNFISGPVPPSFANLGKAKHFHMNNNSLSGQIPAELSRLPNLVHLLLDNNNLSGTLPPGLSEIPTLQIIQLDNNNFSGSTIPPSYGNIPKLLKMSLRNCSLQGPIPDWSNNTVVAYIDLSLNQLNGPIPTSALSRNITTIDLSSNNLEGTLPDSFSRLPVLQKLSVANNALNGSIPSSIWVNRRLNSTETLILDFGGNNFTNISSVDFPANVTVGIQGNPLCSNIDQNLCGAHNGDFSNILNTTSVNCTPNVCPPLYEYGPPHPAMPCYCTVPLFVGYRLKSPGFLNFIPYVDIFKAYLSSGLNLSSSAQIGIYTIEWQEGPRLGMYLKIFPLYNPNNNTQLFNKSEVFSIRDMFSGWNIPDNGIFGPYEFINFTLVGPYSEFLPLPRSSSGLGGGALAGAIVGAIAGSIIITALVVFLIMRRRNKYQTTSKKRAFSKISMKIDGVKDFTFSELTTATNNFDESTVVGQGGYGKVHRGVLVDGTVVAIKRALEGSLQGEREFLTEIELLSRLHHRNLVSLLGYCDEEGEQMLVYEFMANGTLRDHLSAKLKLPLTFAMRVKIALASAKGLLYLHTEADPPIFHRDVKATNILLDSKFIAKVADFGLSKLAPVPELEGDIPSHISTVVKGTPGYLDPEYFLTHKLTDKSDVYSLGVVFLEMLTGLHPISHGKNIVREVNNAFRSGMVFSIIDDKMGSYPSECVERFINLALRCCQDETSGRPSMAEVVRELDTILSMLPESDTHLSTSDSMVSNSSKAVTPPTSTSSMKNPFISQDVSSSDLVSGTMPSIAPR